MRGDERKAAYFTYLTGYISSFKPIAKLLVLILMSLAGIILIYQYTTVVNKMGNFKGRFQFIMKQIRERLYFCRDSS